MAFEVLCDYQDAARVDYMDVLSALRCRKARKCMPAWFAVNSRVFAQGARAAAYQTQGKSRCKGQRVTHLLDPQLGNVMLPLGGTGAPAQFQITLRDFVRIGGVSRAFCSSQWHGGITLIS
eukprot:3598375-Amphidinium_carterae.1